MIEIRIDLEPVPWAAATITRCGAFDKRWREKRLSIKFLNANYGHLHSPIPGYVVVDLTFCLPVPKSSSKKKQALMLEGKIFPTKCDTTNLQKFAEDCIKNILITDDRNVVQISSRKLYGKDPHTLIKVWPLEEYQSEGETRGN